MTPLILEATRPSPNLKGRGRMDWQTNAERVKAEVNKCRCGDVLGAFAIGWWLRWLIRFPSWVKWEIQSCCRVFMEASRLLRSSSSRLFLLSASRAQSRTLRGKLPRLSISSPSVSLSISNTHTHPFLLHHSRCRVYITFIQPAGGKDEEKNTQQWVFYQDECIYSTKQEKDCGEAFTTGVCSFLTLKDHTKSQKYPT